MIAEQPATPPVSSFGFVDDQDFMVDRVGNWQLKEGLPRYSTTSWDEALDWVRKGVVPFLLSDLRFPDGSGLDLLKRARRANPSVGGAIVTEYDVEPWEQKQAGDLGVPIYKKRDQLDDFLWRFRPASPETTAAMVSELEARVHILEALNAKWSKALVERLYRIKDSDSALVTHGEEKFTVAELIADIKALRPRGIEHIELFQKLVNRLFDRRTRN